jgi:hypothetical protein
MDLVGTCPKDFWEEWIAEGDAAGDPESGAEYGWYTGSALAGSIGEGDRFYVVAHGKLRGWAPVVFVENSRTDNGRGSWVIVRKGGAVACTVPQEMKGFRGLRRRWWKREEERPFPEWRNP